MARHNYEPERDNHSRVVSHSMAQRWRCTLCGAENVIAITWQQAKDGVTILMRLERDHAARSPLCIGHVDKQRKVLGGMWQCGDLQVMDDAHTERWAWRIRGTERIERSP